MVTLLLVPLTDNCASCQLELNNTLVVYVGGRLARVSPLRVSVFPDPAVCLLYSPISNALHRMKLGGTEGVIFTQPLHQSLTLQ